MPAWCCFRGEKLARAWGWPLAPSTAEVKNYRMCTSIRIDVFVACIGLTLNMCWCRAWPRFYDGSANTASKQYQACIWEGSVLNNLLMVHTSQFWQSNPGIVAHIGSFSLPSQFLSHSCGFISEVINIIEYILLNAVCCFVFSWVELLFVDRFITYTGCSL